MPEIEKAMRFDPRNCSWRIEGDAGEVRRSTERADIIQAMQEIGAPAAPQEIATESGLRAANVRRLLSRMVRNGDIYKHGYGRYGLRPAPDNATRTESDRKRSDCPTRSEWRCE